MNKLFIQNRKGLKVAVVIDESENQKGLVFLMHGFLGFKEHYLLLQTAKIFKENNFTTISFDATNGIGESDGRMEDGTMTGYLEDLEDVIDWSKGQKWFNSFFYLVGHSLGGYCVANYAARNNVKGLMLFNPKVLGEASQNGEDIELMIEEYKKRGFREWESQSSPGVIKRQGYGYIEDGKKHNLLTIAERINCPVLMVSGGEDEVIPIEQQKELFSKINSKKEIHIIEGGDHNLKNMESSEELHNIIDKWIKDQPI